MDCLAVCDEIIRFCQISGCDQLQMVIYDNDLKSIILIMDAPLAQPVRRSIAFIAANWEVLEVVE